MYAVVTGFQACALPISASGSTNLLPSCRKISELINFRFRFGEDVAPELRKILEATVGYSKFASEFLNGHLHDTILSINDETAQIIERDRIARLEREHHSQIDPSVVVRSLNHALKIVRKLKFHNAQAVFRNFFNAAR